MNRLTRNVLLGAALMVGAAPAAAQTPEPQQQPAPEAPQQPPAQQQQQPMPETQATPQCPAELQGIDVSAEQVKGGVALEVTTKGDAQSVAALRDDIDELVKAQQDEQRAQKQAEATGQGDPQAAQMPPLKVSVKDIKKGALVTVRPEEAQDLEQVREMAKRFEEFWASTGCAEGDKTPQG